MICICGLCKLVNHGIPEILIAEMMHASNEFFNMTTEEKLEFEAHGVLDPIRCSTGFNPDNKNKDLLWREYLRLIVHPDFNCPHKPPGFRYTYLMIQEHLSGLIPVKRNIIHLVTLELAFTTIT